MEKGFNFIEFERIGIHHIELNIDTERWIKECYEYQKTDPSAHISNIDGNYQSSTPINFNPKFNELITDLNHIIAKGFNDPNHHIRQAWINISPPGGSNKIHTHGEGKSLQISGVLYLKTPENSGDISFLSSSSYNCEWLHSPRANTMIIFPRHYPHSVRTNRSDEDRISIAFNCFD